MEAECFENTVSVPAGVRLAIVLSHRYQSLLGGQPAARGASGTVPLSSMSTGRVVDIMSSRDQNGHANGRSLYSLAQRLSPQAEATARSLPLGALGTWGYAPATQLCLNGLLVKGEDNKKAPGAKTAASEPFDCKVGSRGQAYLGNGRAAPCLIVTHGTWYELRLGVVCWERL